MKSRTIPAALAAAFTALPAAALAAPVCSLVTAAEYAAIVGARLDAPPGGSGSTCTATFDRYRRIVQVQVVDGFGESDRYDGLLKFWREENDKARKRGEKVEETKAGAAVCEAKVPHFTAPSTRCMRELKGRRVLYATVSAPGGSGKAPAPEQVLKLLDTAAARAN